jgi:anti-sigma B factor antagonist
MTRDQNDDDLHAPGLSVRRRDGLSVTAISGDLDIARVPVLREQLLELLGPHASQLVIDLSGVTFCDASGLDVLVGVDRRARLLDGGLRLAAPPSPVVTVLRLTGLDRHLQVFDSVAAAVRASAAAGTRDATAPRVPAVNPPGALTIPVPRSPARDDDVHQAVAAVLAEAEAWRDADPRGRFTRALRALARAHTGSDRHAVAEAARSLLAGLLRHPLTHSPPVAATATELRRVLESGRAQPAAREGGMPGRPAAGPGVLASALPRPAVPGRQPVTGWRRPGSQRSPSDGRASRWR